MSAVSIVSSLQWHRINFPLKKSRKHFFTFGQFYVSRSFAVKELPWCAPKVENKNTKETGKQPPKTCSSCSMTGDRETNEKISNFGIVAAMDESRMIGMDGKLPWHLPEDRKHFTDTTRQKVLIIGKNTFYEDPTGSHLSHLRHVIVVSSTMEEKDLVMKNRLAPTMEIARSFEEALTLSEEKRHQKSKDNDKDIHRIDCWVGGGQLLYEKAARHRSLYEIRLTTVHTKCEIDLIASAGQRVALFPAKYRWDNKFKEVSQLTRRSRDEMSGLEYTFSVYRRK